MMHGGRQLRANDDGHTEPPEQIHRLAVRAGATVVHEVLRGTVERRVIEILLHHHPHSPE